MAKFEASNVTSLATATINAPLCAIRAPATEACRLRELWVSLIAATSTRLGLARATAVSITPATTMPGRNQIPGGADSGSLLVSSWTTVPTVSANLLRRQTIAAAIGAGFYWSWPADAPLLVGLGTAIAELCIVNLVAVAPSLFDYFAVWED